MDGGSKQCMRGSDQNHSQGGEKEKKKKKRRNSKWLSEKALQISEKREVKDKGEKQRYIHLNSEFQRIARRER